MTQRLIVPVDGSASSWVAVEVAAALAKKLEALVHVVEIVFSPADVGAAEARVDERLGRIDVDVSRVSEVRVSDDSPAAEIEAMVEEHSGATVVMASHGRGRSAAFVGSVAEDVLQRIFGPTLLVGPKAKVGAFDGPVIVSVDGSPESEIALPLAAAWAIELGVLAWITHVSEPRTAPQAMDVVESAYPARLAHHLSALSGHEVEFEELHDDHPGVAVPMFAEGLGASMIVASSHGRSGLARLKVGSVASAFVRNAHCPVLVVRPTHPAAGVPPIATSRHA